MNRVATSGLLPDRTVLLVLGTADGRRAGAARPTGSRPRGRLPPPRRRRVRRRRAPVPRPDRRRRRLGHARPGGRPGCERRSGCERFAGLPEQPRGPAPARGRDRRARPRLSVHGPGRVGQAPLRRPVRGRAARLPAPPDRVAHAPRPVRARARGPGHPDRGRAPAAARPAPAAVRGRPAGVPDPRRPPAARRVGQRAPEVARGAARATASSSSSPTTPSGCCRRSARGWPTIAFRRYPARGPRRRHGRRGGRARGARQPRPRDRARHRPGCGRAPAGVPRARPRRLHPTTSFDPAQAGARAARGLRPAGQGRGRRRRPRARRAASSRWTTRRTSARCASATRSGPSARPAGPSGTSCALAVDTIGLWYHDLLATALGADEAVVNSDMAERAVRSDVERRCGSRPAGARTRSPTCAGRSS